MPLRIPDYNVVFADWNLVSSIGAFGMFITPFLMFAILWSSKRSGAQATNQVWEGAKGLEWTGPSPAQHHPFTTPPAIRAGDLPHGTLPQPPASRDNGPHPTPNTPVMNTPHH